MDESETKTCTNCKREIPAVNYTIHTVHCARNIKICPVCKEPVPQAELQQHHEKMHKLLPCKKCGESVCGTDLEDHIRDSCAHTIKSCRFCELELPRRELPAHEGYCGARTEQCPDCREWVMIKYRQLHRDSNHGFLRLDDDPVPVPAESTKLPRVPRLSPPAATNGASTSAAASGTNGVLKNFNVTQERPRTENSRPRPGTSTSTSSEPIAGGSRAPDARLPLKRTNDQPQINTNVSDAEKVKKELRARTGSSLGPVAGGSRAPDARLPLKRTNDQPQINTNVSDAEKVKKELRPRTGSSLGPVAGGSRAPDARLPLKRTNDQPQINTNVSDAEKVKKELGRVPSPDARLPLKRTNDQPQINTYVSDAEKVKRKLRPRTGSSLGPVKGGSRAPNARLPLKRTNDQPQINTNVSDAEKVKKELLEPEAQKLPLKRTNAQPQINTNVSDAEKVKKKLGMSRGAVKKRQAPQPPAPEPRRDRAYYSAMRRQQDEERARREQSAVNAAQGEA
ncbi:neurofilament heavy polypeptide-like [Ostrinia nubilalis]|uniref:neurofilament heavy polypeptide-like n=1 Tax=Ostrinia nubilalis TaxID=29057 RepID=UPI0030823078